MAKVLHYQNPNSKYTQALCDVRVDDEDRLTNDVDDVTCKRCIAAIVKKSRRKRWTKKLK